MFSLTDVYVEMKWKRQMCCIVFTLCIECMKVIKLFMVIRRVFFTLYMCLDV